MKKVTNIKSVDFKVIASGYGVVNWNGPTELQGNDGKVVKNHSLPKLRAYTSLTGKYNENGYQFKKSVYDIDFTKNPMYISQNCIRHWLFKKTANEMTNLSNKDLSRVIATADGLMKGYVVANSQCTRKSPLFLQDFVDILHNGNFEQFSSSSREEVISGDNEVSYKKSESSIFSKTTFGDTKYISYGSINIEDLQFISLDAKFGRRALITDLKNAPLIAQSITDYLKSLNPSLNPEATFSENYTLIGSTFREKEVGILLNDDAIEILVQDTIDRISNLHINQAKGYMSVDSIQLDYNDGKPMRIKSDTTIINESKTSPYAKYYELV